MKHSLIGAVVVVIALTGCTRDQGTGSPTTQPISGGHGAAIAPTASPLFDAVTVKTSSYGILVIETVAGASCTAKGVLPSGGTVLGSDFLTARAVSENGRATWTYATPVAGAGEGSGRYDIVCTLGGQTLRAGADFSVPWGFLGVTPRGRQSGD